MGEKALKTANIIFEAIADVGNVVVTGETVVARILNLAFSY